MKTSIYQYNEQFEELSSNNVTETANLVLCFAAKKILELPTTFENIRLKFKDAEIVLCSTAGEIFQETVTDNTIVLIALEFEKTAIKTTQVNIQDYSNSYESGKALVKELINKELAYILVISDGSFVNGSELVKGINDATDNKILVTGGLAGDDDNFQTTLVGLNENATKGNIVAIGFYGKNILVTHGSQGGWDTFGMEKIVTKSKGNKLFEIDNKNALSIYKKYLGPDAAHLPSSALLFPLSIQLEGAPEPIVRTILSIDENENGLTFAGDIPTGAKVRFMRANLDKLITASTIAAANTVNSNKKEPSFALLISCVGRKLVLGPRIEEEIESIRDIIGMNTVFGGFYSYGEISPFNEKGNCQLHNQTMTITCFDEV
ncbi:MAG: FIST N-terminal domain-containing protein [Sediminibacterium sp.]